MEEGCSVCVLDRSAEACEQVTTDLPALAGVTNADVSNLEQVQTAVDEAIARMESVDVLINNAGTSIRHEFLDITPEEWDEVPGVNLTGVFHVAQATARHMVAKGSGVIVNTASTAGKPEEIAALFAFLASEDAGFATGHVYVIDGAETTGGLCSQWSHE